MPQHLQEAFQLLLGQQKQAERHHVQPLLHQIRNVRAMVSAWWVITKKCVSVTLVISNKIAIVHWHHQVGHQPHPTHKLVKGLLRKHKNQRHTG